MSDPFPLPPVSPEEARLDRRQLERLDALIARHVAEGRYPGAEIAIARHGRLVHWRHFGHDRREPPRLAGPETLWLLFSNTKVLTMAALWQLIEAGAVSINDRVADYLPEFAARAKGEITLFEVATHQAGFPSASVSREAWADHARMRAEVADFSLEWTPGSRLHYHGQSAHLVIAMVIEAVTGQDYRQVIRERVIAPLGLAAELFVGVPPIDQERCADIYGPEGTPIPGENTPEFRAAGLPGSGAYGSARAMAAFYQMLLAGGRLNGVRLFSPRLVAFVTRDFTGERGDEGMAGIAMHRGLGPHSRGLGPRIRGLGSLAHPLTFGHGGVGTSYCWGDPESGVSMAYVTNFLAPEPWHSSRLDRISNIVHAAID